MRDRAPTVCRHTVSGTISLPFRGTFHHSLTVLSAIGHRMCLALRDGPRGFRPGFTCPNVLRFLLGERKFSPTGLSPSTVLFPADSANLRLPLELYWFTQAGPSTPATQRPVLDTSQVWAVPVSLATTQGIEFSFYSPATKMFQFADLPLPALCVQAGVV